MLPTLGLCLAILGQGVQPDNIAPGEKSQPERNRLTLKGFVVDDETGDPIKSFTLEHGRVKGQDRAEISWGGSSRSVPNSYRIINGKAFPVESPPFGEFADSLQIGGEESQWMRIVADGYEPHPVTDRPPGPMDAGKTIEVTVRLKRGRPLVGRVLDHTGRPAAGAKLFLIRPGGMTIRVVDDIIGQGSETGLLDPAVTRAVADEQGRFHLTGVGDATAIGVSAASVHFWSAPIPPPGEEPTVRLPEPAKIRIPYAIDGDAPESAFWLRLKPPEHLAERLWVTRNLIVANREEVVLNDATPGEYTLWRIKTLTFGDHRWRTSVEHRILVVEAGHAVAADFARRGGGPIAGAVSGPEGGEARMIFAGVEAVGAPAAAGGRPRSPLRMLDMVACGEGGRFRTAQIPPGAYIVHAAGYRTRPRYQPFGTFNDSPDFIGSVPVTVPPDGNPPEVSIKLIEGEKPR